MKNNSRKMNGRNTLLIITILLILGTFASVSSSSGATGTRADTDLVVTSQIIQVYQLEESPNIIVFQETLALNNTSTGNYTGMVRFFIQDPMYVLCVLNNTIELNTFPVSDDIFAVELSGNNTMRPWQNFQLFVEYAISFEDEELPDVMNIRREVQYETRLVMYIIRPVRNYEVEGTGITLNKATSAEFEGAYVSPHSPPVTASRGDVIELEFSRPPIEDKDGGDPSGSLFYAIVFLMVLIAMALAILIVTRRRRAALEKYSKSPASKGPVRKSSSKSGSGTPGKAKGGGRKIKADAKSPGAQSPEEKRKKLVGEKKKLLEAKKKLKTWLKEEKITRDEYSKLDNKYKLKIKEINKRISRLDQQASTGDEPETKEKEGDREMNILLARKKTLLNVLKNLEKDHDEGTIPEDVFEELRSEYKQEAIKILKNIDELQKNR
jgi:hypothetical protein